MKSCCKETYIQTLKEVVHHIKTCPHKSFVSLISTLEFAVKMVEDQVEIGEITFNEEPEC